MSPTGRRLVDDARRALREIRASLAAPAYKAVTLPLLTLAGPASTCGAHDYSTTVIGGAGL